MLTDTAPAPAAEAGPLSVIDRADTLAEQVYEQLRRSLLTGALRSGQRMTIRALAASMGVSATPVREALGRLVAEGALAFGPNRTVHVPVLTPAQASEIYEIRILLEGMLAEAASRRIPAEMLPELSVIADRHDAALDVEDYATSTRMVFEFKFMIYRSAALPIALKLVEGLWLRTAPHIHLMYPVSRETRVGVRCHRDAVSALRAGDAPGVRVAMQRDLIEHRLVLLDALARVSGGE
ncbi:DNA-binding GntR family transcriptional regulator [Constrictibacter sp. MBR-5]|uniref:GntR family transcriptional regulator n=1 Tax=Constrictibacter sp. MBR-5 TaxID=3156467 RepID=UPI0033927DEF